MMQRCSELGNNPEAFQELFRFGINKLKVKKGPNGHYLERKCQDELQKSLPAKSLDSLMAMVATWMARLDEKDKQVRLQKETIQQERKEVETEPPVEHLPSEDDDNNELMGVVDLCSDGEEKESVADVNDDSFDSDAVLSQSSVIIIDDDLGEVNLKDFADHVEGKLDEETLKQRCLKQQSSKSKFVSPEKPDALRRSLKTYSKKRKSTALENGEAIYVNGEAINEDATTNEDPKILREVNRKSGQKSKESDCVVTPSGFHSVINGLTALLAANSPQQNVQIVTEPSAYYNLLAKASKEPKHSELECKTKIPKNNSNVASKPDPEKCGDAKENEPKEGFNVEQANTESTNEGAAPEDGLTNERQAEDNHVPQIRIRTDLGASQMDVIRVRTDLLHEQLPAQPSNQGPSAETIVPQRTADKRRLSEAQSSQHPPKRPALESYNLQYVNGAPASIASSSYQPSISTATVSSSGYPSALATITSSYQGNPAPAIMGRPPPVNPAPAPPIVTVRYKLIAPKTSAPVTITSTSHQRDVPCSNPSSVPTSSSHHHTSMNPASVSSSGYPSNSQVCPVTSTSSYRSVNPANQAPVTIVINPAVNPAHPAPVVVPGTTATSTASMHSPVIPMITTYPPRYPYQPPNPIAPAPVATSMYQPGAPALPLPPSSYPQVPPVAPTLVTVMAPAAPPLPQATPNRPIPPTVDPRPDLANIMGMLTQVELFAFKQENHEAFLLVSQLRDSLQRGPTFAYHR